MNLTDAISEYVDAWTAPVPNPAAAFAALNSFCAANPSLDPSLISVFSDVLKRKDNRWLPQLFVANVLLRCRNFDRSLMVPMLQAAVDMHDPSSNRDFLTPCLYSFGAKDVIDWLVEKFAKADFAERVGVANLVYWLRSFPVDPAEMKQRQSAGLEVDEWLRAHEIDASALREVIEDATKSSENLVERYFYCLAIPDRTDLCFGIPKDANELLARIAGDEHYEYLLFDKLGWPRK